MFDEKGGVTRKPNTRIVITVKISRGNTDGTDLVIVRIVGLDMQVVRDESLLPEQQGDQAETYRHFPCDV